MANRFWVGGGANTNLSTTGNWSTTSGGAGGSAAPTLADDVTFDGAGTHGSDNCVINAAFNAHSVTVTSGYTGQWSMTGSRTLTVGGGATTTTDAVFTLGANMTFDSSIAALNVQLDHRGIAGSTLTMTANGKNMGAAFICGAGGTQRNFVFADNWTVFSVELKSGTTVINSGVTLTCTSAFLSSGNSNRGLTYTGATIVTPQFLSTETATLTITGNSSSLLRATLAAVTFIGNGNSFPGTVEFTANGTGITGANTFSTLKFSAAGINTLSTGQTITNLTVIGSSDPTFTVTSPTGGTYNNSIFQFQGNQTISGTFTVTGFSAAVRVTVCTLLSTALLNAPHATVQQWTVTAATTALTNCDIGDIVAAGAAAWTGTVLGNLGGCGGTFTAAGGTFTTPVNRYWVGGTGSWSSTSHWSTSSGGSSGASVPLPQDTAYFDSASFSANGQIVTMDGTNFSKIDASDVVNGAYTCTLNQYHSYRDNCIHSHCAKGDIILSSKVNCDGFWAIRPASNGTTLHITSNGGTFNSSDSDADKLAFAVGVQGQTPGSANGFDITDAYSSNIDLSMRCGTFKQNAHAMTVGFLRSGIASYGMTIDGAVSISQGMLNQQVGSGDDSTSTADVTFTSIPTFAPGVSISTDWHSITVTDLNGQTLAFKNSTQFAASNPTVGTVTFGGVGTVSFANGASSNWTLTIGTLNVTDTTSTAKLLQITDTFTTITCTTTTCGGTVQFKANTAKTFTLGAITYTPNSGTWTFTPNGGSIAATSIAMTAHATGTTIAGTLSSLTTPTPVYPTTTGATYGVTLAASVTNTSANWTVHNTAYVASATGFLYYTLADATTTAANVTAISQTPTALLAPNGGIATGTGVINQSALAYPDVAAGIGTANQVSANPGPVPATATGTGAGLQPASFLVSPELNLGTLGTGAALQPTITTATNIGVATATGTAYAATTTQAPVAGLAAATGIANDITATTTHGLTPATALGVGTAIDAAVQATVTVVAIAQAIIATGVGEAWDLGAPAARAAGTGTALDPVAKVSATMSTATGTGAARAPVFAVTVGAQDDFFAFMG